MISLICCTNNLKTYEEMLLNSLKAQNVEYEVVLIHNEDEQYSSASSALNTGAKLAKGDYLVFVHQDITLQDPSFLKNIIKHIDNLNGIVGVAGSLEEKGVITNLRQGAQNQLGGELTLSEPMKVQTLDEVLIACHRSVYELVKFDEITCDDWHLYGVDFCLSAAEKGIGSFVIPDEIYHKSSGEISLGYALSLRKVLKKHRKTFDKIYTTCSISSTKPLRATQYIARLIWDHVIIGR